MNTPGPTCLGAVPLAGRVSGPLRAAVETHGQLSATAAPFCAQASHPLKGDNKLEPKWQFMLVNEEVKGREDAIKVQIL